MIDFNQFCGHRRVSDPFWPWEDKRSYLLRHGFLTLFLNDHPKYIAEEEEFLAQHPEDKTWSN